MRTWSSLKPTLPFLSFTTRSSPDFVMVLFLASPHCERILLKKHAISYFGIISGLCFTIFSRILDREVLKSVLNNGRKFYKFKRKRGGYMPVDSPALPTGWVTVWSARSTTTTAYLRLALVV